MTEIIVLKALMSELQMRAKRLRKDERGEVLATLIIMAALAAAAIAVGALLYTLLINKAKSIPTD